MTYSELNYSLGSARDQARQAAAAAQMDSYARYQAWGTAQQHNPYGQQRRDEPPVQPPPIPSGHWSLVLGVALTASKTEINKAYRAKAKLAHADAGGSDGAMVRLNLARDQALKERKQ